MVAFIWDSWLTRSKLDHGIGRNPYIVWYRLNSNHYRFVCACFPSRIFSCNYIWDPEMLCTHLLSYATCFECCTNFQFEYLFVSVRFLFGLTLFCLELSTMFIGSDVTCFQQEDLFEHVSDFFCVCMCKHAVNFVFFRHFAHTRTKKTTL